MKVIFLISLIGSLSGVWAQSLSLSTAIHEALSQGASAKIESEKKVKTQEFENEKRGMLWPTVAVYANAGRGGQPVNNMVKALAPLLDLDPSGMDDYTQVTGNQFAYGLEASGPLYTFGKVSTAIETAELQTLAVDAQVKRSLQEVQGQVVEAYANALLADQRIELLRRSLGRAQETYTLTERDFNAGKGMKSDLLLAKASIKSLEAEIIGAQSTARMARHNLNRLLGRPTADQTPLDTSFTLEIEGINALDPSQAVNTALNNRADLQALQTSVRVFEGTAKIFQANYYPTLAYAAKAGFTGSEPEHMVDWVHRTWSVGVGLNWTIFDGWGGQAANRALAAQWKSDARVFQFQAAELSRVVEMSVHNAISQVASSDSAWAAALEGRDAAAEAVAFMKANFPGGMLRLSDLMSGEEALRNAEFGVLASRIACTKARAELQLVIGQDLVTVTKE